MLINQSIKATAEAFRQPKNYPELATHMNRYMSVKTHYWLSDVSLLATINM